MKVAVVFLVVLGILAAASASLLVSTIYSSNKLSVPKDVKPQEVEILVAARDLPAMALVDAKSVRTKKVPKSAVSEQSIIHSVQVVGRIVTSNVLEDQPFTKAQFDTKQSGVYLASSLPKGKRAMSVSLPDWSGMAGLLYPGSIVDLLVSFRPASAARGGSGDQVSTTLLQGLQVLAIGAQSVAAEADYQNKERGALSNKGQVNHRMVTVMVDPKQAEVLQLATQNGSISLAMRNPMDVTRETRRLTRTSEILQLDDSESAMGDRLAAIAAAFAKRAAAATPAQPAAAKAKPMWETLIIRGTAEETRTFPMPAEGEAGADEAAKDDPATARANVTNAAPDDLRF